MMLLVRVHASNPTMCGTISASVESCPQFGLSSIYQTIDCASSAIAVVGASLLLSLNNGHCVGLMICYPY